MKTHTQGQKYKLQKIAKITQCKRYLLEYTKKTQSFVLMFVVYRERGSIYLNTCLFVVKTQIFSVHISKAHVACIYNVNFYICAHVCVLTFANSTTKITTMHIILMHDTIMHDDVVIIQYFCVLVVLQRYINIFNYKVQWANLKSTICKSGSIQVYNRNQTNQSFPPSRHQHSCWNY